MHPSRQRQVEVEKAYRLAARRERRKEAIAAVVCCAIVFGLTILFLLKI